MSFKQKNMPVHLYEESYMATRLNFSIFPPPLASHFTRRFSKLGEAFTYSHRVVLLVESGEVVNGLKKGVLAGAYRPIP